MGPGFVYLRDTWMMETCEGLGLEFETTKRRTGRDALLHHLDGDPTSRLLLLGLVDGPHATGSDDASERIGTDSSADEIGQYVGMGIRFKGRITIDRFRLVGIQVIGFLWLICHLRRLYSGPSSRPETSPN